MRSVLACAAHGETKIGDTVDQLAEKLALTADERAQLLPSGKQTMLATACTAGRALGQSGDVGVNGVIDQDPLGVDQSFVQAGLFNLQLRRSSAPAAGPGTRRG